MWVLLSTLCVGDNCGYDKLVLTDGNCRRFLMDMPIQSNMQLDNSDEVITYHKALQPL